MSLQIPDARTPDHLPAEDVFLRVSSRPYAQRSSTR
jgi:hypothetical protein